ncbi:MAG: ATP phosphoribosyltransferase regulatory subunit [archaeon]
MANNGNKPVRGLFEPAKGTRDWYAGEAIVRNHIRDTLRGVFERYGYDRLETAALETKEAITQKGGTEIAKEIYQLRDQGERELCLRFDQTLPFARYLASNPNISFPFKRYAIGPVFRDGPTQPDQGRYREFTQCDVDVAGISDMAAEAELLMLARDAFSSLGLGGVEANVNNRKLLEGILDAAEVPKEARGKVIIALDKMDKIGVEGVRGELNNLTLFEEARGISNDSLKELFDAYDSSGTNAIDNPGIKGKIIGDVGMYCYEEVKALFFKPELSGERTMLYGEVAGYTSSGEKLITPEQADKVLEISSITGENYETLGKLENIIGSDTGKEGLKEVRQLLDYAGKMGVDFVRFNPVLARGLAYYTGTTMEVFLKDKSIVPSAILAGGRFDDMVGDFRGKGEVIPAVGFSFGLERLAMIIKDQKNFPNTVRQVYVIPVGDKDIGECLHVADRLRQQGLNVDMKLQPGGKVGKQIQFAENSGIPYAAVVGEAELGDGTVNLRDFKKKENIQIPVSQVGEYINSNEK